LNTIFLILPSTVTQVFVPFQGGVPANDAEDEGAADEREQEQKPHEEDKHGEESKGENEED
jgi:hypothetical protein